MTEVTNTKLPREEDIFDYQIGLDEARLPVEQKHFFDTAGYLLLEDLLNPDQVRAARDALARAPDNASGPFGAELLNLIERGGVLEDAMALPAVLACIKQFVWGRQHRLIGSRAIVRPASGASRLTQGGQADPRRYAQYRCVGDGQFRCLMMTCLIALQDTSENDGAFCVVPGSHKAVFPHPYENSDLDAIAPLRTIRLRAGSGVLYTESLSHAFKAPAGETQLWLAYHYGTSYMVNWPGCESSAELLIRTSADPIKSHLLLEPYYHPAGAQKKRTEQ
jgi:hypothetical protein